MTRLWRVLVSKRSAGVAAAAALTAVLALAACESAPARTEDGPQPQAAAGKGGPAVVAPGKPGEPARTLSPEEAREAVPPDTPNSADFSYAQMMIVHHGQALEMTALAAKQAASTQVKQVAARIAAAQQPEIDAMRGWLKNNGGPRPHTGHDHGTMPGMATDAQLAQLRDARGEAFDELFLKLMITHHQGAVTMAGEVLSEGNNVQVEEMANDVIAQQTAEINRMRSM
ncbi:DUF305 domain-containing protein [Streptomyces sp. CB03238]|uniref:DUF305 domain-containing protein n=1 Tax=Streptomyces sp. CB03238 TaxID=1907777 RepID=UPI000A109C12|nr:DUF305 domain-containing protein [Streptomyces sp. CB03238]ORT61004.1 DUF305 domain-containing protein [Streptomyces sp. CB03238]